MPRKTPPFKNYPAWTQARFFGFIRSGLREKFNRYPVKYAVLKDSSKDIETGDIYKTGKKAGEPKTVKMYECASCNEQFRQKDVQVDHIVQAGSLKTFDDLSGFAERLFCGPEGLQILCTTCHDTKTKMEKQK